MSILHNRFTVSAGLLSLVGLSLISTTTFADTGSNINSKSKSSEKQARVIAENADNERGKLSEARQFTSERVFVTQELNKEKTSASKTSAAKDKIIRAPERDNATGSLDFEISSAYATLIYDQDLDGYYSEFSVDFDADTNFTYADVFAELYLSLNGGPWELYHVTQVFEIQGWSYNDDYQVTTLLTEGYPPGSYDILIDLIDTYDNSLVATVSADTNYQLAELPLEDTSYENSVNYDSDVTLFNAEVQLLTDQDNDGFYRSYSLQFDADVDYGSTNIYAEIWIKDDTGVWTLETTTEVFNIDGNSTLDTYILETTLESGYATGYYDFKIDLYDASTDSFLTSSDNFDSQLAYVPLEDAASDVYVSTTTTVVTSTVSVESGGAGAAEIVTMLLLLTYLATGVYRSQRVLLTND